LEIGLLHPSDSNIAAAEDRAPSLEMWREYFPNAEIFGFDIRDFSRVTLPNCTIVRGDMSDRHDLDKLKGPFDIIIEDGSHASHHQQIALGALFPKLVSGGHYFIEDLNWVPIEIETGIQRTRDVILRWRRSGEIESPVMVGDEAGYLFSNIASIELYDSHDILNHDRGNALACLVKQ
jgi:hypothetical protein